VQRGTYSGTYTVNADCTGIHELLGGKIHSFFVIVDGGSEFFWMQLDNSFFPSGFTLHGIEKRI
jgi:hypothetical protein